MKLLVETGHGKEMVDYILGLTGIWIQEFVICLFLTGEIALLYCYLLGVGTLILSDFNSERLVVFYYVVL